MWFYILCHTFINYPNIYLLIAYVELSRYIEKNKAMKKLRDSWHIDTFIALCTNRNILNLPFLIPSGAEHHQSHCQSHWSQGDLGKPVTLMQTQLRKKVKHLLFENIL